MITCDAAGTTCLHSWTFNRTTQQMFPNSWFNLYSFGHSFCWQSQHSLHIYEDYSDFMGFRRSLIANWKLEDECLPSSRQSAAWWRDYCRKTSPHRWSPGSGWPCRSCPDPGRARPPTGSSCMSCSVWLQRSANARRSSGPRRWGYPLHPRRRANKRNTGGVEHQKLHDRRRDQCKRMSGLRGRIFWRSLKTLTEHTVMSILRSVFLSLGSHFDLIYD